MNYNNFRRSRSPPPSMPFGFEGSMRPMPNHREFDLSYHHQANSYDGPGRPPPSKISQPSMPPMAPAHHHNQMASPMPLHHPYMDLPSPHQNYPPHYREPQPYGPPQLPRPPPPPPPQQQPSNSYRSAMTHRDPYMSVGPPHGQHQPFPPPRPGSPPFKILCVTNISSKISDGPLKDALTSDFSRFGDISVSVCHDNGERLAYIYFRNCNEAREARQVKTRTLLFDRPIEIEPIYEPQGRDCADSPGNSSPAGPATHSPHRRSISPQGYPHDPNAPVSSNRRPQPPPPPGPHQQGDMHLASPAYPTRRGSTPPEYGGSVPGGYHQAMSPPPMMGPAPLSSGYDRRAHSGSYPYPPAHTSAPYASPPHDPSRQSYAPLPPPYPPQAYERERGSREPRAHVSPRSPYRDSYYPPELRGGPPTHDQGPPPARRRSSSRSRRRSKGSSALFRDERLALRHRYPAEPPARYMSREYRREKFGSEPHPSDYDEGRPSRVLLLNNIDATKTDLDLKEVFEPFGTIEEIEVKKVASDCSSAIVKFSSMDGAYKAKTATNGRHIGSMRCRIVYGKVSSSRRLWIGGLSPTMTVPTMEDECGKYGDIVSMDYTSGRPYCYVEYESANQAQFAAYHMRTTLTPASERKIRIEFVDPDRSEKLLPRQPSNPHLPEFSSRERAPTESICDIAASPHSSGGLSARKRSLSPTSDLSASKRTCPPNEIPLAANIFKQERLVAAAAAKARTSSATSFLVASQPIDKDITITQSQDVDELNNNSDSKQSSGDGNSAVGDRVLGLETASHEAPSPETLTQCSNIRQVVACCPVSWSSRIALRNFIFPAQIFMCSGRKQIIDKYLTRPHGDIGQNTNPLLRITQRWRLHPQPKLEEVKRRMQSGNLGILILTARQESSLASRHAATSKPSPSNDTSGQQGAPLNDSLQSADRRENELSLQHNGDSCNQSQEIKANETHSNLAEKGDEGAVKIANFIRPTGGSAAGPSTPNHVETPPTPGSSSAQSRPLRNLISYLEQKDAAGVISLSATTETNGEQVAGSAQDGSASSSKLLYAFPPGDFAWNLLKRKAPNLLPDTSKDEFLLGVIVGGNLEGGKI